MPRALGPSEQTAGAYTWSQRCGRRLYGRGQVVANLTLWPTQRDLVMFVKEQQRNKHNGVGLYSDDHERTVTLVGFANPGVITSD